jgi:NitT/TauT family transport system substrate-binding protein
MRKAKLFSTARRGLLAVAVCLGCVGTLHAQAPVRTPISIASLIVSSSYLPLWVAQEQGIFARNGIDARILILESAFRHIGGDNKFGVVGVPAVMQAVSEGKDLKLLTTIDTPRVTALLMARPDIKTPEDLKGKRFGVASIGTGAWINSNLALERFGIEPTANGISFVELGSGATALLDGIEAGRVDVVSIDAGQASQLKNKGFSMVLDMASANIQGVQSGLAVDAAYLREHPEVAQKMVASMVEGLAFALAPQNEAVVKRILAARMGLAPGSPAVDTGYRSFVSRASRSFAPIIPAIQTMQRVMGRANPKVLQIDAAGLVDDRFVRALHESGAVEKLFREYGVR